MSMHKTARSGGDFAHQKRTHFLFSLRDTAPLLGRGLSLDELMNPCPNHGLGEPSCDCCSFTYSFWQIPGDSSSMESAAVATEYVLNFLLQGTEPPESSEDTYENLTTVVLVGGPLNDAGDMDEHFGICIDLARLAMKALCIATGSARPNVSLKTIWPPWFILESIDQSDYKALFLDPGAGSLVHPGTAAKPEELLETVLFIRGLRMGDPVALFRDFFNTARGDIDTRGDYAACVLNCAIACELLIKHTSWMLHWEDLERTADADEQALLSMQALPSMLIGSVLSAKLEGNWSSQTSTTPVGAWRAHVAKMRNQIMHFGQTPNRIEARAAMDAIPELQKHISARLLANKRLYPKTHLLMSGGSVVISEQREDLIQNYQAWLRAGSGFSDAGADS